MQGLRLHQQSARSCLSQPQQPHVTPSVRRHPASRMLGGGAPQFGSGGAPWSGRRPLTVSAMFGFKWPFSGSSNESSGENSSVLQAARVARKRGCELAPREAPEGYKLATFAGGCFWGLELAFQRVPGVVKTSVGYTQGKAANPTYDEVCMGFTGHTEAVQCTYDPKQVTYRQLLDVFFDRTDPTTLNRQGNDRGTQYRSGVYWHDEEQRAAVEQKVAEINEQLKQGLAGKWLGQKVVSELKPAGDYYLAEAYHQQYLERGGRFNSPQSAAKGCNDKIRCYG